MKYPFLSIIIFFSSFLSVNAQEVHWADTVLSYSSSFNYKKAPKQYRPEQVLGAPSVMVGKNFSASAYAPKTKTNDNPEFLEVGFKSAIEAKYVYISQNANSGFVSKVVVKNNALNESETIYIDTVNSPSEEGALLVIPISELSFRINAVRVEMNTSTSNYYNQIDAIGISESDEVYSIRINQIKRDAEYKRENLGDVVNSNAKELLPIVSPDGNNLYIVRQDHEGNIDFSKQNVWRFDISSAEYKEEHLGYPINFKGANSGVLSVTPDGQQLLLLNVFDKEGNSSQGISISEKRDSTWSFPAKVEIEDFYNNSKYGEYCLSNSGNILILAAQRDDNVGGKDLYVSFKKGEIWSRPQNLGSTVNSGSNEISPFLASDNRTLYFSTKGFPGYGDSDIFMTRRIGNGWSEWTTPVNLGEPYNSDGFDAYLSIPASGEYVYFSSSVDEERRSDIFRAKLDKSVAPQSVVLIKGIVKNSKTNENLSATINYYSLKTGEKIGAAHSDPQDGSYQIVLPAGNTYGFSARKENFLPISSSIDCEVIGEYTVIERDLFLTPLEKGAKIILNNIYFSTAKYDLRKESFVELDQLVEIMKTNTAQLLISGHTDNVGTDEDNQILSENRAKSVVEYLVEKGIERSRLTSKGFGEKSPIVANDSPENRQKNRRVEFEIVSM